jgi:hypothetical protein
MERSWYISAPEKISGRTLMNSIFWKQKKQVKWDEASVMAWLKEQTGIRKAIVKQISPVTVQQLTHQQIKGQFIRVELKIIPPFLQKYSWQPATACANLPFPKFITGYLETPVYSPVLVKS